MNHQIKIYGDIESSSVYFINSTVSPKGIGTIEAYKKSDEDRIVIIRNDKYESDGITFRQLFKRLNPLRVQNKNGIDLVNTLGYNIDEVIDYINGQANLFPGTSGGDGSGTDMTGKPMDFVLDDTSTSIMSSTGHDFGVNTIKAIPSDNGLIAIKYEKGDLIRFKNIDYTTTTIKGEPISGGRLDVVDKLNELFTVGAFEAVVIKDPFSTIVANVGGITAGYTEEGVNFLNPAGADIGTNSTSNNSQAGIKSVATISKAGEYYTFDIRGKSTYGFGLVHSDASYANNYYSGNATYADPSGFCVTNNQNSGFQFSHWFHVGNAHASWTNYGANTSYNMGAAWYDHNNQFDEKEDWNNNDPVTMKVGLDENGFIAISTKKDDGTFVLHARSNYPAPEGVEFHLGVKMYYNTARLLSEPKVHLLEVDDTPTTIDDTNITILGDATGTLDSSITTTSGSNSDNGFITNEGLSASGEYFEFEVNLGEEHTVALVDANIHDIATIEADNSNDLITPYVYFGQPINNLGAVALSQHNNSGLLVTVGNRFIATKFRIGFDNSGKLTVWSSDNGTDFVVSKHLDSASPNGDYRLMWIGRSTAATFESLSKGELEESPTMYFRYIESPDGVFHYPLFATEEEAKYYHKVMLGLETGVSHTHVYPDDPTNTVWHMPDNGQMNGVNAPYNIVFNGQTALFTEITSLTNADLTPTAFADTTITVDELTQVNYQLSPVDVDYVTTIGGIPAWTISGNLLQGIAPEVTGDNITNPSDTTTVTVYRTRNGFTSTGTLTIVINNLTAPTTAPDGFTLTEGSMADANTLDSGSVVTLDDTLAVGKRLIVSKSWVETNVLPNITGSLEKAYVGVPSPNANWTNAPDLHIDFDAVMRWEGQSSNAHKSTMADGSDAIARSENSVGSATNAYYNYAIQWDGTDLVVMADIDAAKLANEYNYTQMQRYSVYENYAEQSGALPLVFATKSGGQMDVTMTGISFVSIPVDENWIQVTENSNVLSFDGNTTFPTLQAGYTYRLLVGEHTWVDHTTDTNIQAGEIIKFTADGSTEYDMGGTWTQVGTEGTGNAYIEFTVPTDVPPLHWYGSTTHNPINLNGSNAVSISGSTYIAPITGVSIEGPTGNFTGNVINSGTNGWITLNESLSAGERLVLDSAFIEDLWNAMPDYSIAWFGLKGDSWSNTSFPTSSFKGLTAVRFYKTSSTIGEAGIRVLGYANGSLTAQFYSLDTTDLSAFLEITSLGNNIRVGVNSGSYSDNPNTTAYADWNGNLKVQTGDQGYGITSREVVFYWQSISGNTVGFDISDVDWTGLTEINVPNAAVINTTSWTKALDFSGSNEHAIQVSSSTGVSALRMTGIGQQVPNNFDDGRTSAGTYARPWAVSIVFKTDRNFSNQHIWNSGEGAGSSDDNIYLRTDSAGNLYFGWGRGSDNNECQIIQQMMSNDWHSVYICHKGGRFSASNATAQNLADAFDIRYMSTSNNWTLGANKSTTLNWISTGNRTDRGVTGWITIGGRGNNRSFHGKVGAMVVTTLRKDKLIPTDAEIKMMITDPEQWLIDYKEGQPFRYANSASEGTFRVAGQRSSTENYATQVWLMGDGFLDSYANGVRSIVLPTDQNYTKLQLNSMVSNDIQTVSINGLTT